MIIRTLRCVSAIAQYSMDVSRVSYLRERLRSYQRRDAVFIWIPKSAGTSVYSVLNAPLLKSLHAVKWRFPGRGIVTFGHMDYADLVADGHVSQQFDVSAYKFVFVRDPYARAVSLYSYLQSVGVVAAGRTFLDFCRELSDHGCPPIGPYNSRGLSQCNPQMKWIERTNVDFIGRVESIEDDLRVVLRALGASVADVPRLNASPHRPYWDYYCDESKGIVEDMYSEDFRYLEYAYQPSAGTVE